MRRIALSFLLALIAAPAVALAAEPPVESVQLGAPSSPFAPAHAVPAHGGPINLAEEPAPVTETAPAAEPAAVPEHVDAIDSTSVPAGHSITPSGEIKKHHAANKKHVTKKKAKKHHAKKAKKKHHHKKKKHS